MFKKFTAENISSNSQVKSSIQRGIRTAILEQYPSLNEVAEDVLPKKQAITVVKCYCEHGDLQSLMDLTILLSELCTNTPPFYPGANIMCPGLTSPGAKLADDVPANAIGVFAEGKQHALAIGLTKLSTHDIRTQNKGIGVDNIHYLADGLWTMKTIE